MCIEEYTKISQALISPLIALGAGVIAYMQWKTNETKLKIDLYTHRLRIFTEVKRILSIIATNAGATTNELLQFNYNTSDAVFLFDKSVAAYIDDRYKRGTEVALLNEYINAGHHDRPAGYDHKKTVEKKHSEIRWFLDQFDSSKRIFGKYLMLDKAGDV